MKGIVFNLLEEVVVGEYGEEAWDAVLENADLEGAYTSLGNYEDAQLGALVAAASEALGLPEDDIVRWYGRNALPLLAERYPAFFEPHDDVKAFALTLNDIIHPEVRKLYPGADTPYFEFENGASDRLVMLYSSPRRLCAFAEGLLLGAADHYDQSIEIVQPECMNHGDERCRIEITTV